MLDAYEDHSQPFRVDDLELSAEDRPERLKPGVRSARHGSPAAALQDAPPQGGAGARDRRPRSAGGGADRRADAAGAGLSDACRAGRAGGCGRSRSGRDRRGAESGASGRAVIAGAGARPLEATGPLPDPTFEASATPSIAALPMPPQSAAFASPFEYCADIPNKDEPDLRLIGEGLPPELIDGVRQVTNMPDGEVRWRCMNAAVWICAQPVGGAACGKVPTAAERQAYCDANPGAQAIAGGPPARGAAAARRQWCRRRQAAPSIRAASTASPGWRSARRPTKRVRPDRGARR